MIDEGDLINLSLEFTEKNLNEVYTITSGLSKSSDEFGFGFPFLSFKTIFYNYYIINDLDELVNSTEEEQTKHSVKKGDVFLTRTSETLDELGMSCVALRDYPNATFNGFTKRLRPKKDKVINPLYACYYFRSPLFRKYVDSMAIMTTRASLNNNILSKLPIIFPNYEYQKKIGYLLYNLDKKIELNKRINNNLITVAKAIFRDRFIFYHGYESQMINTDYGEIPNTFDVKKINDISKEVVCGKTPSTKVEENYGDKMPFITIPDMHGNVFVVNTERKLSEIGIQSQIKKILPKNSICVSCIATAGLVSITSEESQTNQQINSIICKEGISPYFVYLYMGELSEYIKILGSGGSTTLNLNKREFAKIELAIPPQDDMNEFHKQISPLFEKIKFNQYEINKLTKLRDTLLPKLMSGEIDVSNINDY